MNGSGIVLTIACASVCASSIFSKSSMRRRRVRSWTWQARSRRANGDACRTLYPLPVNVAVLVELVDPLAGEHHALGLMPQIREALPVEPLGEIVGKRDADWRRRGAIQQRGHVVGPPSGIEQFRGNR